MILHHLAQVPSPPSTAQTWLPAALTAIATVAVGYLVYRNARRANSSSDRAELSKQQLAWTQQAMSEAKEAKEEARLATSAAKAATVSSESAGRRADDAEKRLTEVSDLTTKLIDWISRVVRKANEVDTDDGTPTDVRELLRAINGGPPEISTTRLHSRG